MNEILLLYSNILDAFVKHMLTGEKHEETNPVNINKAKFYSRSFILAYIYVRGKTGKTDLTLSNCRDWLVNNVSSNCLFANIYNSINPFVIAKAEHCIKEANIDFLPKLGTANEQMLAINVLDSSYNQDKVFRNRQGSYYSPLELVSYLVKSTIDHYVESNGLEKLKAAKIVDVSCGDGIFLTTSLRYICSLLKDKSKELLKKIITNLYACDVDCLALEIAKLNILDIVGDYSLYNILSKHFRHANFLLHTEKPLAASQRLNLYSEGFIYHQGLSVGLDFLQEYDIILGNPPWEKIRFEEVPYYSQFSSDLANLNYKDKRLKEIEKIENRYPLVKDFGILLKNETESSKKAIKNSSFFHDSAIGELNTCNLFIDACYQLISNHGVIGLIIKTSSITASANKRLFDKIKSNIFNVTDFINRKKYFAIDGRERFALLSLDKQLHTHFKVSMNITDIKDIDIYSNILELNDLQLLNPKTGMLPNLSDSKDLNLILSIYHNNRTLSEEFPNIKFGRLVHLTNHAKYIDRKPNNDNIPIYEGKFFTVLNGRYSGFNNIPMADRYKSKAHSKPLTKEQTNKGVIPESRFFIKKDKWISLSKNYEAQYMLAWHSLTSATNERTCVSTLLPFVPGTQSIQFLICNNNEVLAYLTALFSSVVFDFVVKNKMTGIDLTQSVLNQIAVPSFASARSKSFMFKGNLAKASELVTSAITYILKDDTRLKDFWKGLPCINGLDKMSRMQHLMILDVVFAQLYGLTKYNFAHILSKYVSQYNAEYEAKALALFDSVLGQ